MLLLICVLILAAGIVCGVIYNRTDVDSWCDTLSFVLIFIGSIAVGVSLFFLIFNYVGADGYVAANNELYESLTWQYENNVYENDNDIGKRELIVDIQEWNTDLARYKELQDNFWVGVYIPDIYDQFEFIELGGDVG